MGISCSELFHILEVGVFYCIILEEKANVVSLNAV